MNTDEKLMNTDEAVQPGILPWLDQPLISLDRCSSVAVFLFRG